MTGTAAVCQESSGEHLAGTSSPHPALRWARRRHKLYGAASGVELLVVDRGSRTKQGQSRDSAPRNVLAELLIKVPRKAFLSALLSPGMSRSESEWISLPSFLVALTSRPSPRPPLINATPYFHLTSHTCCASRPPESIVSNTFLLWTTSDFQK